MPELPDIENYVSALRARIVGRTLQRVELKNPFLLRTAEPALTRCEDQVVVQLRRIGKRIAIGLQNELWLVFHLMIAGRLHWYDSDNRGKGRPSLIQLSFDNGRLTLTEAGTKRRASLHVVRGDASLSQFDRGGLEVAGANLDAFVKRMSRLNHTLKRALTDPTILSGIGNAYSDEILFRARLSPLLQTNKLTVAQWEALWNATQTTLAEWTRVLRDETAERFPENVTAFRDAMSVHGRFNQPCRSCGTSIQRIRYADNETNYCPRCQTDGRLLADRALSRLLKDDWPKTIEALENRRD